MRWIGRSERLSIRVRGESRVPRRFWRHWPSSRRKGHRTGSLWICADLPNHGFVIANGSGRGCSNAYADKGMDVGSDIFNRGLCLPSDIKMTGEEQDVAIEVVHKCFG